MRESWDSLMAVQMSFNQPVEQAVLLLHTELGNTELGKNREATLMLSVGCSSQDKGRDISPFNREIARLARLTEMARFPPSFATGEQPKK